MPEEYLTTPAFQAFPFGFTHAMRSGRFPSAREARLRPAKSPRDANQISILCKEFCAKIFPQEKPVAGGPIGIRPVPPRRRCRVKVGGRPHLSLGAPTSQLRVGVSGPKADGVRAGRAVTTTILLRLKRRAAVLHNHPEHRCVEKSQREPKKTALKLSLPGRSTNVSRGRELEFGGAQHDVVSIWEGRQRRLEFREQLDALRRSAEAADSATIAARGPTTVTVNSADAANSLTLSSANATLNDDGASASLTIGGTLAISAGTLNVATTSRPRAC